jgi:hypothetical protein
MTQRASGGNPGHDDPGAAGVLDLDPGSEMGTSPGSSSGPEPGRRPCPGTLRRSRPPRPRPPGRRRMRLPGASIFLFRITLSDEGGQGERTRTRRYLESESGCLRCKRRGCFVCISCVVDALPGQCLRRAPGANPLVAAVFKTKRLRRERSAATCQRRRRPGQARRRQGRLQITPVRYVSGMPAEDYRCHAGLDDLCGPVRGWRG